MKQKGRVGVIFLVFLLILSLAAAGVSFYFYKEEKVKIVSLNEELENLRVEKRIVDNQLAKTKETIEQLDNQLQLARTQINDLTSELEVVKGEKDLFYSEVDNLQTQVKKQRQLEKEWEAKQRQAQNEIVRLQELISKTKQELDAQISRLKTSETVALGKIVVGQNDSVAGLVSGSRTEVGVTQAPTTPGLEGKVLVVNDQYDFAVINLGSQDGISVNDTFLVYHDDNYIGDIKADKIQEIMSACAFTSGEVGDKISEGDKVIRK